MHRFVHITARISVQPVFTRHTRFVIVHVDSNLTWLDSVVSFVNTMIAMPCSVSDIMLNDALQSLA